MNFDIKKYLSSKLFSGLIFVLLIFSSIPLLSSCTMVGFHKKSLLKSIDFGRKETLKICFLKENDITDADIDKIFTKWNKELNLYNISLENAGSTIIERPGFFNSEILNYLFTLKLHKPCDRMVYLRGRKFSDFAFEFGSIAFLLTFRLKIETYGAVETITDTRGFIRAKYIQLGQSLFTSPGSTMVHEGYHLLGCGHSFTKTKCYEHIKILKDKIQTLEHEEDFFPVLTKNGIFLASREDVNARMLRYIRSQIGKR